MRARLHAYIGAASRELQCPPLQVGGVADHLHILARNGREITQAEWVKEIKRVSSRWMKTQGAAFQDFEWQRGYAVFSVSRSNLDRVRAYVAKHVPTWQSRSSSIGASTIRASCAPCCGGTAWNGMKNFFGIEPPSPQPLRG